MATFLFILQLLVVLSMIFVGARVGGIGLGIYGMQTRAGCNSH